MDDPQDQDTTLTDTELPDLDATQESDLPDLGGDELDSGLPDLGGEATLDASSEGDLPDLGGDLPDLGAGDDLPDLGDDSGLPDLDAGGDDLPSLGDGDGLPDLDMGDAGVAPDLDLADLKSPVAATAQTFEEISSQDTPKMAASPIPVTSDNAMAFRKIQGIKVRVQVMLGETRLSVSQLANLKKGEFIRLDTKVGEPVNILANGELIARGEIAVEDEETPRFGITLTEIIDSSVMSG